MSALQASSNDGLALIVQLAVMSVFGIACAVVATGRGRSGVGWFFIGLVGGCFGLIILLVLPNPKQEQEKHLRLEKENRRLREQLKKDRQVADQRHLGVERRLGVHDQALGVDTGAAQRLGAGEVPPELLPPAEDLAWYYAIGNERLGPVSTTAIRDLRAAQKIGDATLVWAKGMVSWQTFASVPELGGQASA